MDSSKLKPVFVKTLKFLGIGIVSIFVLMLVIPYFFSDTIKSEIKKAANTKLAGELNYKAENISFFKHFPSLTLTLNNFELNGSAPYQKEKFITAKEVSFGINISSLIFTKSISIDEIY